MDQENTTIVNQSIFYNSSMDIVPRCSVGQQRTPAPGTIPYYFGVYILPIVSTVGILGNILNLLVLNSKGMRTKTNCFLSAMAATDLCFLLMMTLFNLSAFDALATSESFLKFYYNAKITFLTLANWFSAASIWIAVAVTVERLVAIHKPLHARLFWETRRIIILLASIYLFSFYLSVHYWFWMWPASLPLCNGNGRRVYGLMKIDRQHSPATHDFVLISQYIAIACTLIIPVLALIFLNSLLLYFLRRNRRDMLAKLAPSDASNAKRLSGAMAISVRQRSSENKVAFMVSMIMVSFVLFLSPSAFMYIYETIGIMVLGYPRPTWLSDVAFISNQLVTVNKAMNFVLYCSAGKHFRRKLLQLITKRLGMKWYRYRNQLITSFAAQSAGDASGQFKSRNRSDQQTTSISRGRTDSELIDAKIACQAWRRMTEDENQDRTELKALKCKNGAKISDSGEGKELDCLLNEDR